MNARPSSRSRISQTPMKTEADKQQTLRFAYHAPAGCYDELHAADGSIRPHWQLFTEALHHVPEVDFIHRTAQAEQLLSENGVTFNVFGDATQSQRPWRLDLVPFILPADEWRYLEFGLSQRARLLQAIIRDAYSTQGFIKAGLLPAEVLFAHPGYDRTFQGMHRSDAPSMVSYAAELARAPNGRWCVMADRAEAPAGAAFALENRIVASRTLPPQMHRQQVQRLAQFFQRLQNTLKRLGVRQIDNPRIVLLSPGPKFPYYFEDVYLARYLGYTLVEGGDLAVRDDRVFLKTLAGLAPVDVILSRGTEGEIDPLELGGGAPHGVPGLLHAIRKGHVTVANTPGCGLIESPVFMAFLPSLCQQCLGEELAIPSIATWWCGQAAQLNYVEAHLQDLVIKPAFQASGGVEFIGANLSATERRDLWTRIRNRPYEYVAQETIARSAIPVWKNDRVSCGHAAVRTFLVADTDGYSLMPGGLVRVAATTDPMELSIAAGDGSKDLWVLTDAPVEPISLLGAADQPVALRRTAATFPSRVADDLFWLGQSLDRADFLSRLLRAVFERLTSETELDWPELPTLLRSLADQGQLEPGFTLSEFQSALPTISDALPGAVADRNEVHGISFAVAELLRLASLVRLWISPDTWRKVHDTAETFHAAASSSWTGLVDVLSSLNQLILDLAAVSGLIHDGMIRGPAWRLLDIGRRIERARDVAKLVRCMLADGVIPQKPVLKSLLEVVDCRMTYRSRYLENVQQNAVLDLCLTDETNPRSVVSQLVQLVDHVEALPQDFMTPLRTEEQRLVLAALHGIRQLTQEQLTDPEPRIVNSVLEILDEQLRILADVLTRKYLLHSGTPRQINTEMELS